MPKSTLLLGTAVLFALMSLVAGDEFHCVQLRNNDGSEDTKLCAVPGTRNCYCVKNTQTASIQGINGASIKLFGGSTDCTGSYGTLGSNSKTTNAQWVKSISVGKAGIPSKYITKGCIDWYRI